MVHGHDVLLAAVTAKRAPAPRLAFQMPAVDRVWPSSRDYRPPLKVVRHPLLFPDLIPEFAEVARVRRSRSAARGWQAKLPSRKLNRTVRARSLVEQRALERCEIDGDVLRYCEQPITITYLDRDGRKRRHTPDFFYETAFTRSFVEVKWEADARKPTNESRWPDIAAAINSLGFQYEVLTERHILRRPAADNVALLLRFRRAEPMSSPLQASVQALVRRAPLPISEILTLLPAVTLDALYRGIVDGWLWTDFGVDLGADSLVRLPHGRESSQ